jgi:hypothetical protein
LVNELPISRTLSLYRADAAFAKPEVYGYLEQRGIGCSIQLSANEVLQREIEPLLQPPIEELLEQPIVGHHDFLYQEGSWDRPGEWWPRRNGIRGSCFPEWALS